MRRFEKDELLKIADAITRVHDVVGACLERGDTQTAISLLAECQDSAARLGETIEKLDPCSAAVPIEKLEKYCETAYRIAESAASGLDRRKAVKKLNRSIESVRNSISNDIPSRLEVVFLPYKASMWDSMESVWMAARDDPDCDAYVIPIPYYDRNPDMSFGQYHYEGDKFPADVPVTFYEKYDLSQRKPDIIYIHNPYDHANYVTTVHPDYYSEHLRKCTNMLVYIDYGIPLYVPNDISQLEPAPRDYAHPAWWYSNLIVAYSNEFANATYYSMLSGGFEFNPPEKKELRKKIVALGSSKFDCIVRLKREEHPLPAEWENRIAGKKVLLLNTSLHELLMHNEACLKQIRDVIHGSLQHEDIVLWWRPHPLIESTIRIMRPMLYSEYMQIVSDFIISDRGIYDESSELHRAIAWSDACLTDISSLAYLYLASGKPFFISSLDEVLPDPIIDNEPDFHKLLSYRIENMKAAKGANLGNWNLCIWWGNFYWDDFWRNIHYENFLNRFIHFITHQEEYPEAEEYSRRQLQLFYDFVANPDGTAGQKIFEYTKRKAMSEGWIKNVDQ